MEWLFHTRLWSGMHGGLDVRLGGGVATVRQYLRAGLVDDLHLALRPVLLGSGEALPKDLDLPALGYDCVRSLAGERATHLFLARGPSSRQPQRSPLRKGC